MGNSQQEDHSISSVVLPHLGSMVNLLKGSSKMFLFSNEQKVCLRHVLLIPASTSLYHVKTIISRDLPFRAGEDYTSCYNLCYPIHL